MPPDRITLVLGRRQDRPAPAVPPALSPREVAGKDALDDVFLDLLGETGHARLLVFLFGHGYHVDRHGPIFISPGSTRRAGTQTSA